MLGAKKDLGKDSAASPSVRHLRTNGVIEQPHRLDVLLAKILGSVAASFGLQAVIGHGASHPDAGVGRPAAK